LRPRSTLAAALGRLEKQQDAVIERARPGVDRAKDDEQQRASVVQRLQPPTISQLDHALELSVEDGCTERDFFPPNSPLNVTTIGERTFPGRAA